MNCAQDLFFFNFCSNYKFRNCILIMIIPWELIILTEITIFGKKDTFKHSIFGTHRKFCSWNSIAKLSNTKSERNTVERFIFSSWVPSMSNGLSPSFFLFFLTFFCCLVSFELSQAVHFFFILKLHKRIWSQWEMQIRTINATRVREMEIHSWIIPKNYCCFCYCNLKYKIWPKYFQ